MKIKKGLLIKGTNRKIVKIPKRVIAIGQGAFKNCEKIEKVILSEGLKLIGDDSFENCISLKEIVIPNGVIIGERAFMGCKSLEKVTLPNDLTHICERTFERCELLQEIEIPNSVVNIGKYTFNACQCLERVNLSKSLNSIDEGAFSSCAINSIEIPNGVVNIGNYAFHNCQCLERIVLSESLNSIDRGTFENCKSLKEIVIPNSVTSIESNVFLGCSSLEIIELPERLTRIYRSTFRDCFSLKHLKIPKGVGAIEDHAFEACTSLLDVTLPESITWIGKYAFNCCESLKNLVLYDKIKVIGEYAFNCCYNLELTIKTSLFTYENRQIVRSTNSATFWVKELYIYGELVIPNKDMYAAINKIRKQELLDKIKQELIRNNINDNTYFTYDEHRKFIEYIISYKFDNINNIIIFYDYRDDFSNYICQYISKIRKNKHNGEVLVNKSTPLFNKKDEKKNVISKTVDEDDIENNKYIQIIYNGKICNVPLDVNILRCIEQQDDVEIKLRNNYVVREDEDNDKEKTFQINNALRRVYLNLLFRLNISEDFNEHLKRYDKYMEYDNIMSVIDIKTIVDELAFIYYSEYTSKLNNMHLNEEPLIKVRLDKKSLIKKLK